MSKVLPLLAILLAAPSLYANEAEDKAVEAVKRLGGNVARDHNDPAHTVVEVNLCFTEVTVADLKEMAALQNLQKLDLSRTHVTGAGLKEMVCLQNLQTLILDNTRVTDAGLKELATLKNLQRLDLNNTQVTDAGLKDLAALKNLESLDLNGTHVRDAGLKDLAALKNLEFLNLMGTNVTDPGLKDLAALKNLQYLALNKSKVLSGFTASVLSVATPTLPFSDTFTTVTTPEANQLTSNWINQAGNFNVNTTTGTATGMSRAAGQRLR
jgi:internalin A